MIIKNTINLIQNCLINRSINKSILDIIHHAHLSYILYNHIHLHVSTFYFLIYHYICICDLRLNLSFYKTKRFPDKFPINSLSEFWKNANSTKSGSQKRSETEEGGQVSADATIKWLASSPSNVKKHENGRIQGLVETVVTLSNLVFTVDS